MIDNPSEAQAVELLKQASLADQIGDYREAKTARQVAHTYALLAVAYELRMANRA